MECQIRSKIRANKNIYCPNCVIFDKNYEAVVKIKACSERPARDNKQHKQEVRPRAAVVPAADKEAEIEGVLHALSH